MKYIATIEARMSSSRLPGKVLLPANGKPMLLHLVERLQCVESLDEVVLATTVNPADDELEAFSKSHEIKYYRGSEDDVLARVIQAAESVDADVVVEISGDCPLVDPELIAQCISIHKNNNADFVSNAAFSSYPGGMDVSIFSVDVLKKSYSMINDDLHKEHVCLNIVENPDIFSRLNIVAPPKLNRPELQFLLDEEKDYSFICKIIESLGKENPIFSCEDVIDFLDKNPSLLSINSTVQRKGAN